jgi:hypothetical protein
MSPFLAHRTLSSANPSTPGRKDLPLTVRDPVSYLNSSPKTGSLWVERKQIPHLRVMGYNIRLLKLNCEPLGALDRLEGTERRFEDRRRSRENSKPRPPALGVVRTTNGTARTAS